MNMLRLRCTFETVSPTGAAVHAPSPNRHPAQLAVVGRRGDVRVGANRGAYGSFGVARHEHRPAVARYEQEPSGGVHGADVAPVQRGPQGAQCGAGDVSRLDHSGRFAVHAETRRMREAEAYMQKKIIRALVALVMGLLFTVTVSGTALAQETPVSGTVTSLTGERLAGVTVQVRGATTTTTTDANGKYSIRAPSDGVLLFALIGYKGAARTIASRPQIDIVLDPAVAVLEPVIVTGYTAQRRADITGSVSSVNVEGAQQQTSTSVLQRLDGRVPGVTVEAGGAPGSRSTVRIRGVTGLQNNDRSE